ncbi:MAG: AtpZ/AtpI family protein [Nitrospinota bacterium]|nr:AtpZ/AtpI family protein [Nitrospinota bacterium]
MSKGNGFRQGLGIAFRLGIEITIATMIGALMGYALDRFLDTRPWFLVVGVLLGGAAGCINVYRAAQEITIEVNDNGDNEENNKRE